MNFAARELPDEPRLYRAEENVAPASFFTRSRNVIEEPLDLRRAEIRINDEPRLFPNQRSQPLFFPSVAGLRRPPALPDNRVMDRLARLSIPQDGRFALIRNPDRRDVFRLRIRLLHRLDGDTHL